MNVIFTCNDKHDNFRKKDIKKSDFIVQIEDEELKDARVQLNKYNKKTDKYELVVEHKAKDGKVVFKKELFENKKYLINVYDGEDLIGTYIIEFKDNKLLLLLIPFLILLGLLSFYMLRNDSPEGPKLPTILDSDGDKGKGDFETDLDALQEQLNAQTQFLNIRIASYINVIDDEGFFKIYNSNEDKNIQVIFYMYDKENKKILEDEIIYVSPLLEPNENIGEASLTKHLEPGEYNVVAMFYAYDFEDNFLGNFGQEILINAN